VESYSGISVTLKSMLNNVGKKSVKVFSSFQKRHAHAAVSYFRVALTSRGKMRKNEENQRRRKV
jgi:hypothetical protein